jgi:hypothetical protein
MSERDWRVFIDFCHDGALIRHDSRKLTSLLAYMACELLVG